VLADTIAFVVFQIPLYATILAWAGADLSQIVRACASFMLVLGVMGRPYGVFLEFVRQLLGAPAEAKNSDVR